MTIIADQVAQAGGRLDPAANDGAKNGCGGGDATGPLVSVVICVYNPGVYLRPSIASILDQSYRNLDIVVIDDGSTDGSVDAAHDLLADARIRVIRQQNAGQPTALNRALELVRGEFVAIHDADDISAPLRIEKQIRVLAAKPQLGAVFCGDELILNERRLAPVSRAKDEAECRRDIDRLRMPAHDPTAMYRAACLGGMRFDDALPGVQSLDFVLRFGERHPLRVLGECLYGYRIHPGSITKRDPSRRDRLVERALRQACLRRGLTFEHLFPPTRRSRRSILDNSLYVHFIESVVDQRRAGKRLGALRTGLQCLRLEPLHPHYYKALVYALIPNRLGKSLRRRIAEAPLS
jgi:glycosyltransferase involved in cell wall biosynthesis